MNDVMTYGELKKFYKKSSISFSALDDWWRQAAWEMIEKNGHTKTDTFMDEIDTLSYAIGLFQFDKYIESIFGSGYEAYLESFDYEWFMQDMVMDEISKRSECIIERFDLNIDVFDDENLNDIYDNEFYEIVLESIQHSEELSETEAKDVVCELIKSFIKARFVKKILDPDNVSKIIYILKKEWGREGLAVSIKTSNGKLVFLNEGEEDDPSYYCENIPNLSGLFFNKSFYCNHFPDEVILDFYEDNDQIMEIFANRTASDLNMHFFMQWI